MLSIHPINNIAYYADLAQEDYYLGHGEPKGNWAGLGSRILGLYGEVINDDDYINLMAGFSPAGEKLVQNAGKDNRRLGWDCTFSAPKSVTLAWVISSVLLKKQIENAQKIAVDKAIKFMERYAALTRRGYRSSINEKPAGLVIATFEHCSNRNEDPHLHTHALVLNLAPRLDDTWGSLSFDRQYFWKMPSGAIYRAELAHQMHKLGFEIEPDEDSFHLKGIPKEACDTFSSRAKEIERELKKSGIKSSSSKEGARFKTKNRSSKKKLDRSELFKKWIGELANYGLTDVYLETLIHQEQSMLPVELDLDVVLSEITEKKAVFTEQEIFRTIAVQASHQGMNGDQAEKLSLSLLDSEDLIELQQKNVFTRQFTSVDVFTCETLMINDAKDLAKRFTKKIGVIETDNAVKLAEKQLGFCFDDEQKEAIYYTLCSGDLSITQGSAGAGKTTLMLAAKIAYEQKDMNIKGACIAKKAADNLMQETGIQSHTVASLITALSNNRHPLNSVDVLVVDEAGLLPSTDLQLLINEAKVSNCKIILTGEDKQLDAINRGGSLRFLSRPEIIGTQRIETIRRQRETWAKQVVMDIRDKRSEQALESLEKHNCIHWADNNDEAIEALINDWHHYQKSNPEKQSLVIAREWKDVKKLSKAIRKIYISEGKVSGENVKLVCSVADKKFEYEYSVGDRVKFCRNEYQRLQVSNGALGTILQITRLSDNDAEITIALDDKRIITFRASEYSDDIGLNLCHAYALTIFSSQGTTIDGNTFTLYSGRMGQRETYVALSRHKDESHVYVNKAEINERVRSNKEGLELTDVLRQEVLAELMKQDNHTSLAIEYTKKIENQDLFINTNNIFYYDSLSR